MIAESGVASNENAALDELVSETSEGERTVTTDRLPVARDREGNEGMEWPSNSENIGDGDAWEEEVEFEVNGARNCNGRLNESRLNGEFTMSSEARNEGRRFDPERRTGDAAGSDKPRKKQEGLRDGSSDPRVSQSRARAMGEGEGEHVNVGDVAVEAEGEAMLPVSSSPNKRRARVCSFSSSMEDKHALLGRSGNMIVRCNLVYKSDLRSYR